tara:strand:+ start:1815 stop:2609 length:795 start_codon:yes stop_codon:yes gene_type:complete
MAEPDVSATTVNGSESAEITTTVEEVQAVEAASAAAGPETFGVNQAQFDKYYSAEDKSYNWEAHAKELQFVSEQRTTSEPPPQQDNPEQFATAEDAVDAAGLDWDDLSYKIGANGDIDAMDYERLEAMGIPRNVIETHVQSVSAQAQDHVAKVTDAFGGREEWIQTQAWANRNLGEVEINQLNSMLAGQNYLAAVMALKQRAGTSNETSRLPQTNPGTPQAQGYASQAEMVADQRKPEYKRDPAFRQHVAQRAAKSDFGQRHTL